jgi:hypothetical protein
MTGSTEVTFCVKHGNEGTAAREPFDFTLSQEQKHEVFDLARVNVLCLIGGSTSVWIACWMCAAVR